MDFDIQRKYCLYIGISNLYEYNYELKGAYHLIKKNNLDSCKILFRLYIIITMLYLKRSLFYLYYSKFRSENIKLINILILKYGIV